MFTDSIDGNLETIRELMQGVPPSERENAKKAAYMVEKVILNLQRDYPKNSAVALGTAFALFMLAQRIVQAPKASDTDKGMVELLS
jgi:hypothetical protein